MKRRSFITGSVLGAASTLVGGGGVLTACSATSEKENEFKLLSNEELNLPPLLDKAPEGKPLRFGLVGCGGRGLGAAGNLLSADDGLAIVAVAEALPEKLAGGLKTLREQMRQTIADDHAFLGFDAYKKVLASDIDAIIIAVPSRFHPAIFRAAVEAGKHVFVEKPCGVDPEGVRSFMATAKMADQRNLSVVCGTQRRHGKDYCETYRRVAGGMIGEIVGGACYWNTARTWYNKRKPEWTDTEYILYNWLNYTFMGGDVIVDHHVHNLDAISWFMGNKVPIKALGQGAKVRPSTGNKYDFFMIDYEFENNVHICSSTRHVDGCTDNIAEVLTGTKGSTNCVNTIWDSKGNVIWEYEYPKNDKGDKIYPEHYVQEHIDWVTSIRTGKSMNEAHNMARSTLIAIMGRNSAYSGKTLTWDEILTSQEVLGPDLTEIGKVDFSDVHPLPGLGSESRIG